MKKKLIVVLVLLLLVAGGVLGYFYQAGYFGSVARVEPAPTVKIFEAASAEDRAAVQKGIDAIEAGDLGLALAILDELQYELIDITPEQQASLMDLVQQIRTKLDDKADAALEEGQKKLKALKDAAESAGANATEAVGEAVEGALDAAKDATTGNE